MSFVKDNAQYEKPDELKSLNIVTTAAPLASPAQTPPAPAPKTRS
jgi:hypothetical protein